MAATVIETPRLILRGIRTSDAAFMLSLFNDPAFIRFIGDRGVRTAAHARAWIAKSITDSDPGNGLGAYLVDSRQTGCTVGLCSLLQREWLPHVDLGFAFLPANRNRGYAAESASALVDHAINGLGVQPLLAITDPDNAPSIKLLGKLGFELDRKVHSRKARLMLFSLVADRFVPQRDWSPGAERRDSTHSPT